MTELLPSPEQAAEEAIITHDMPRVSPTGRAIVGTTAVFAFAYLAGAAAGVREPGD